MIAINQRLVRGEVSQAGQGLFLRLVLDDQRRLYLRKGDRISLVTDKYEGTYQVRSGVVCPAGEDVGWLVIERTGQLPERHPSAEEIRAGFRARM